MCSLYSIDCHDSGGQSVGTPSETKDFDMKMKTRYLDDLKEGERLQCRPVVMTREGIIEFGEKFDP